MSPLIGCGKLRQDYGAHFIGPLPFVAFPLVFLHHNQLALLKVKTASLKKWEMFVSRFSAVRQAALQPGMRSRQQPDNAHCYHEPECQPPHSKLAHACKKGSAQPSRGKIRNA